MKKIFFATLLFIIIFAASFLYWKNGLSAVNSNNKQSITFVIEKGTGLKDVSSRLETAGLIKSRIIFFLYARLNRFEGKIQAGNFNLSPSMSVPQIAQNLTHGAYDISILFKEGLRATEIAEILKGKISTYDSSWAFNLMENEGYLFPDTYSIPADVSVEEIINLMTDNFNKKYSSLDTSKTKLSKKQIVILASLVEREAKFDEDRPLVASVLLNRFEIGMKLDIDATVQYALGFSREENSWWKKNLTFEDLEINSPYNTYLNASLPPAPIANPGLEALKAVVNPSSTDYIYYISDDAGHLHFAKTLEEQNANMEKFGL